MTNHLAALLLAKAGLVLTNLCLGLCGLLGDHGEFFVTPLEEPLLRALIALDDLFF